MEQGKLNKTVRWSGKESAVLAVALLLVSGSAMAVGADPMGTGICNVVGILKGKTVFGSAVAATIAAGLGLLFGGEMDGMLKKLVTTVLIVGLIFSIGSLLSTAFNGVPGFVACP